MRFLSSLALLACLPSAAHASAVVIWPVDPVIKAEEHATALWLENKGDKPVTLQVRTFAWSQPTGEDKLDRQDGIVASPPIATVAPGGRQLVRIIRRAPGPVPESCYRLLIDELPTAPPTGATGPLQAALAVQMRYSIPLFTFAGAAAAVPRLEAHVALGAEGRVLTIRTTGTMHARLTDLRMTSGGREIVVKAGLAGYVLPGATVTIALPADQAGRVTVGVNGVDQVLGATI
jgi:fimbrial chaperone protein